eukprot:UN03541
MPKLISKHINSIENSTCIYTLVSPYKVSHKSASNYNNCRKSHVFWLIVIIVYNCIHIDHIYQRLTIGLFLF